MAAMVEAQSSDIANEGERIDSHGGSTTPKMSLMRESSRGGRGRRQFFPYHPQFQIDSDPERGNGRPNPRMSIFDPRYLERVHPNNIEIYWGIVQGLHPVISKLPPPVEYDKRMNHSTECAICLEDFKDGEFCRILRCKCNNVFHQRCIDRWLLQMHTCPVCRVRV
ncbi:hypothetical protein L1049_024821 [Liquidambar formosana]|uniref:RING-type E3 ubiquitin transferase n=1 Tax=Liquidambar formosana TaxID=63359 RepID=A0AAP0WYS3_LIQFO